MFMSPKSAFNRCEAIVSGMFSVPSSAGALAVGLANDQAVPTPDGPRPANMLRDGDMVSAADGAPHTIKRVMRRSYGADLARAYPEGLVFVPQGTLGCGEDLYLLPDQPVGLGGLMYKDGPHGQPAMLRARAMAGIGAVQFVLPVDGLVVTRLLFDQPVAFAAGRAMTMMCPAARQRPRVLSDEAARRIAFRVIPQCRPFAAEHRIALPARAA